MPPSTPNLLLLVALTPLAHASYDESTSGDFSDDRFNPTPITFDFGINIIQLSVGRSDQLSGDRDYFTFTLADREELIFATVLETYNPAGGPDETIFMGLAFDSYFDFDPDTYTGDGLAGYVITDDRNSKNLIPELSGTGQYTLGPGSYTFWIQQTADEYTDVTLGVTYVPAPATTAALLALAPLAQPRRRHRHTR